MSDINKIIEEIDNKLNNNFSVKLFKKESDGILIFRCDNKNKEMVPSIIFMALNPITKKAGTSVISPEDALNNSRKR